MNTRFEELPAEVQEMVKSNLHVYDQTHVSFEYGKYHVSPNVCLKAEYGEDHREIGTYRADEIFTEEERIENYINAFGEYPIEYKGKRDYEMMRKMQEREMLEGNKGYKYWQGKLIDGNFELTEQKTRIFEA